MTGSGAAAAPPAPAATAPASATPPGRPRDPDLILARLHLRLGSLSLARTELETLAGRGGLDDEAIRDLAEARWRTGDVAGAGEAAGAWIEGHPDDILGLVIAAEAQAALGRPGEARRLAGRALERADGSLDPVFAGMQRSAIWPVDPTATSGPVGVLFDDLHPGPMSVGPLPSPARGALSASSAGRLEPDLPAALASGPSLWGEDASGPLPDDGALDPTILFHGARIALDAGHTSEAATGLILALRASPGLAPAVLDLLSGRSEPILSLVRGDAQRIVGREVEAMRDHAVAAGALGSVAGTDAEALANEAPGPNPEPHPAADPPPEPEPTADLEDT